MRAGGPRGCLEGALSVLFIIKTLGQHKPIPCKLTWGWCVGGKVPTTEPSPQAPTGRTGGSAPASEGRKPERGWRVCMEERHTLHSHPCVPHAAGKNPVSNRARGFPGC